MAKSRKRPGSKRSEGIDRHVQPRLVFHLPQAMYDALEAYIEHTKPTPDKSAVLRHALEEFLVKVGRWPPGAGSDG